MLEFHAKMIKNAVLSILEILEAEMEEQKQGNNIFKNIVSRLSNFKHFKTIFVVFLSIIVVVIFASSFKRKTVKNSSSSTKTSSLAIEYCKSQENRLEQVLENVKGISNVKVFVMVDEGPTLRYVEDSSKSDSQNNNTITTTTVIVKNGTISQPIVVVETLPKIKGVLVIAKGAGNIKTKSMLTNIISSVLCINISNVEVLEGR